MLHSLSATNSQNHFDIYVLFSSLSDSDFKMMEKALGDADADIHRIRVDEKIFDSAPVLSRISKETYYRLLISEYIPDSVHRLLYIDPDVVIKKNLDELYNIDMQGNTIAAASHMFHAVRKFNLMRLNLKPESNYINAGIMLIDVDRWKKEVPTDRLMSFISSNIKKLKLADQDVVNMMLEDSILLVDERKFNLDEKIFFARNFRLYARETIDSEWVRENTVIIHYNGKHKPWRGGKYRGRLGEYFEKYRDF